jgi:hypothetical protein
MFRISHRTYLWLSGFVMLFDGMVRIMTLGKVPSSMDFRFCLWSSIQDMQYAMLERSSYINEHLRHSQCE